MGWGPIWGQGSGSPLRTAPAGPGGLCLSPPLPGLGLRPSEVGSCPAPGPLRVPALCDPLLEWGLQASQMGPQPWEGLFQRGRCPGKVVTVQDGKCPHRGGRKLPRLWDLQGPLMLLPGGRAADQVSPDHGDPSSAPGEAGPSQPPGTEDQHDGHHLQGAQHEAPIPV